MNTPVSTVEKLNCCRRQRPKRDYYVVQRLGRRMISFRLGPVALAFLGVSGQRDRARIDAPSQGVWRGLDLGVDERKEGREKLDPTTTKE